MNEKEKLGFYFASYEPNILRKEAIKSAEQQNLFKPINQGRKDDQDKLQWSLLPFAPLKQVVKVMMFGAKKYSRDNWQKVEDAKQRYTDALLRHTLDYTLDCTEGDSLDKESRLPTLGHVICCALFLLWFDGYKE